LLGAIPKAKYIRNKEVRDLEGIMLFPFFNKIICNLPALAVKDVALIKIKI